MTEAEAGTILSLVIIFLVIAGMLFLCGIIAAAIAGAKGRSRLLGFLLGACLGIFGIAGAVIMGEGADRARQKRLERLAEQRMMMDALGEPRRRQLPDEWDDDDEWEEAEILDEPRRPTGGYRMLPGRRRRRR